MHHAAPHNSVTLWLTPAPTAGATMIDVERLSHICHPHPLLELLSQRRLLLGRLLLGFFLQVSREDVLN